MTDTESARPSWPLVGRDAELGHVRTLLRSGRRGVVLAGAAGVGKTHLAGECLALAAAEGLVPVRVAATQSAAGLPFGAFASLVPDLPPGADRLEVLRRIAQAVVDRGGGRRVAVLVDDAHLLDDASAALVHLLAAADQACVVATLRSGEVAPDPVVALWKDGLAERLEVQPLGLADIQELLTRVLDGSVDGAAAHALWKRTQGNALFLRELVLGALAAGDLRCEGGIWRLHGPLPASSRLAEIIETRLGHLDDDVRRSLGVLALGEPLEVDVLQTADPAVNLAALEDRGLVHVEQHDRRLRVRLHHPLYGEFLRSRLSPLRARASARVLAETLKTTGARRREDVLRLATWSLDGGATLEPQLMLAAATTARERHDLRLAERLARAAIEAGAGFDAGLLLGQVCWLQGRAAEAEDHLSKLAGRASTDEQRVELASTRMNVLDFGLKRADLALTVAEEAEAAITDPASRHQITADRARILGRSGNYQTAAALAGPLLEVASGRALVTASFAAATAFTLMGRLAAAVDATERGLATHLRLTGPPLPFGPYFHLMIRGAALTYAGRLAEAGDLLRAEYARALGEESVEAQAWLSWMLSWVALNEGRAATAARIAGESAGAFREFGWRLMVRCALMFRAHALALVGDVEGARGVLSDLDALGVPPAELNGPEVNRARAWTAVAGGDVVAAHGHLRDGVAIAREGGGWALESGALHDLARLGRAEEVAGRLHELCAVVEGPVIVARAAHAAALADDDPAGLDGAAAAFGETGAILLAAEATADAAVAWRRRGEPRRATAAERRSALLATRCEGARTPALTIAAPARAALTPRELEIAQLAAAGVPDKEIAARLYLSHRTVENRLHIVYEKLGVAGRAELRDALETY